MTPEEVELAQTEYDRLYNAHNVYARWCFADGHIEALLDEVRRLHKLETELARLRRVEEAARAILDDDGLRFECDVERLQQALDSK